MSRQTGKSRQRQWWNADDLTPFARRIRDYMLDQRPTMNVADLSKLLRMADPEGRGVSQPAIWDWFNKQAIPKEKTVHLIASATGLPVSELRQLADLPSLSDAPWAELTDRVEREDRLPSEAKQAILAAISEVRERYDISADRSPEPEPFPQTGEEILAWMTSHPDEFNAIVARMLVFEERGERALSHDVPDPSSASGEAERILRGSGERRTTEPPKQHAGAR